MYIENVISTATSRRLAHRGFLDILPENEGKYKVFCCRRWTKVVQISVVEVKHRRSQSPDRIEATRTMGGVYSQEAECTVNRLSRVNSPTSTLVAQRTSGANSQLSGFKSQRPVFGIQTSSSTCTHVLMQCSTPWVHKLP